MEYADFSLIARSSPERRKAIFSGFIDGHKILKVVSYSVCSLTDAMTLQVKLLFIIDYVDSRYYSYFW